MSTLSITSRRRRSVLTLLAGILAFLSAPPAPVAAQRGFTFRGGLNLSRFVGGDTNARAKRGLNLGGALRLVGAGSVGLWVEGYYRQKGAESLDLATAAMSPTSRFEVGIDYVEVPVLLRIDLPSLGSKVRPYVQGGPAFGWKLDCSVSVTAASGGQATPDCRDLLGGNASATLRDYEQGVVFGGGLDLHVLGGLGALNLDARLTRGLSRLARNGDGPDVKNQSFTLMLGYSLSFPGMGGGPRSGGRPF